MEGNSMKITIRCFCSVSFFILFCFLLNSCGVLPGQELRGRRTNPDFAPLTVTGMNGAEHGCVCDGAEVFSISNSNSKSVTEIINRYSRNVSDPTSEIENRPIRITFEGNSTWGRVSRCSISKESGSCSRVNIIEIQGIPYPDNTELVSQRLVKNLVAGNLEALGADFDISQQFGCIQRCESGNPALCERKSIASSPDFGDAVAVRNMLARIDPELDAILIDRIKELLNDPENSCKRSDIVFREGLIYNYGANCVAKGKLPGIYEFDFLPKKNKLDIEIPNNFIAFFSKDSLGNFSVRFLKSLGTPNVSFQLNNEPIKLVFGHRIDYVDGTLYFKLGEINDPTGTCFALDYNDI